MDTRLITLRVSGYFYFIDEEMETNGKLSKFLWLVDQRTGSS